MKALTIHQPWAHLIIHGIKRVENRAWQTNYRGPLLIHAGVSRVSLGDAGEHEPPEADLVFGALLGTVRLLDCVRLADAQNLFDCPEWLDSPFTEGPYCLLLTCPLPLRVPIPYRGRQRIFDVPDEFVRDPAGYLLGGFN